MKVDDTKLIPAEVPDEVSYHLVDFFYHWATTFDGMHHVHTMRHKKAIIDGRITPINAKLETPS